MDEQQNTTQSAPEPVAKMGTHVLNTTAESLAEAFGKPVADAAEIQRKQESQLATFYDMLVNTPGHLGDLLKRATAANRDRLPVIKQDGKERHVPYVVKALVDKGYTPLTAENLFSNMTRMRQAYVDHGYVPNAGTPWKDAYAEATKLLGVKRKERRQSAEDEKVEAQRAGFIANEMRRLSPEQRKDPVAIGEATMRGLEAFDDAQARGKYVSAGIAAIQAIGGEQNIPELIEYLDERLKQWQSQQSAKAVAPMEVPTAKESPQAEPAKQAVNQ